MTTLHMETDTVRAMASQLKQATETMRSQAQSLNSAAQSIDWLGPSRDEFVTEAEGIVRQLDAQLESGTVLAGRVESEVAEWEEMSASLGLANAANSANTVGDAPDKTDWLTKELFINLYILEETSVGSDGSMINAASKLDFFFQNVKTGGNWDYKNNASLKDFSQSGIILDGTRYANDVPGNIMYGFIGASLAKEINTATLGLNADDVLLGFAGYVQAKPNATKEDLAALLLNPDREVLLYYAQKLDDPLDSNAIKLGIELYKQGPSNENLSRLLKNTELRKP